MVIAIVFQHEIRQGLTRVSALRWLTERRGQHIAGSMATDCAGRVLIGAPGQGCADRDSPARFGGGAPDRRHRDRGAPLVALIEAIFTSTSSLHDGAIVVGRNRLSRAGVILPLATDSAAADSDDDSVPATARRWG